MAALSRMANGTYKNVSIISGDCVVLSSSAIPGNGIMIEKLVNLLTRKGADVVTNSIYFSVHASGHPSKQELRFMIKLARPKYFMPIHGEYRMLKEHGKIAESLGVKKENIFIMENGDSIVLNNHEIKPGPHYLADDIYIDGNDINGVGSPIIKDRAILKDDGLVALFVGLDLKNKKVLSDVQVKTKGYIYQGKDDIDAIKDVASKAINDALNKGYSLADIKTMMKNSVSYYIERKTDRSPMIIPLVMEENSVDLSK